MYSQQFTIECRKFHSSDVGFFFGLIACPSSWLAKDMARVCVVLGQIELHMPTRFYLYSEPIKHALLISEGNIPKTCWNLCIKREQMDFCRMLIWLYWWHYGWSGWRKTDGVNEWRKLHYKFKLLTVFSTSNASTFSPCHLVGQLEKVKKMEVEKYVYGSNFALIVFSSCFLHIQVGPKRVASIASMECYIWSHHIPITCLLETSVYTCFDW